MASFQKSKAIVAVGAAFVAAPAFAQNSVTLYGIVDATMIYQNSQTTLGSTSGGHSAVKMGSGTWAGSRFGLKGSEDLGGGYKAIFQLESGFNVNNGGQQYTNAMFGRQAWVGVATPSYGTLTAGRQYTAYYLLLSRYSPTAWLAGVGTHPGDLDALDVGYRANNSLVYMSRSFYGMTAGGSYSFAGVPGSVNAGSTWSGALQYLQGPFGIAVGFMRTNNSAIGGGAWGADSTMNSAGESGVSAVTNGYQQAQAQQRFAVTAGYAFDRAWDISMSFSNVQYIPGVNSRFTDSAIFNTAGAVLHWKPTVSWDFAGGYSYTRATKANGITDSAQYQQVTLSQYYSLSKRTGLYAIEAFQRAHGNTLGTPSLASTAINRQIQATATIGGAFSSAPSSSASQSAVLIGIVHRF